MLVLLWVGVAVQAQTQTQAPKVHGVLEQAQYDAATRTLALAGWTLGGIDGKAHPLLQIDMQGEHHQTSALDWVIREDVRPESGLTGGQRGLGFTWRVRLNKPLASGVHPLLLQVAYVDGSKATLTLDKPGASVLVVQAIKTRHWALLLAVLASVGVLAWAGERPWVQRLERWCQGPAPWWGAAACFVVLVGLGINGSSIGILLNGHVAQSALKSEGAADWAFRGREVRGDEWGVLMPNTLAQWNHQPRFPVVNSALGEGGQNMGVVGMTGTPVRQWAAWARPATWGYFFLPLRQAMSWQWQLPFWGGMVTLWAMLNLFSTRRAINLGLALAFCLAPYATAWSNWPLYVTLFPALGMVAFTRWWQAKAPSTVLALGVLLGWLGAAWALVLYPAWIITVGTLLALVMLGWCWDHRRTMRLRRWHALAGLLALGVVGAMLGSWWLDTREAVALMRATEYPGGRGAMPGGDLSWWWQLRGYTNAETLRSPGPDTNASEASSYFVLPWLLLVMLGAAWRRGAQRGVLLACVAYLTWYVIYAFVGVPIWLAQLSLWGTVPTNRMDVGLGLVAVVIAAVYFAREPGLEQLAKLGPALVAALSAGLVVLVLLATDPARMPGENWVYTASMAVPAALMAWWALRGRAGLAVGVWLVVHLAATVTFNPISRAPKSVALAEHALFVRDAGGAWMPTLVIGDGMDALVFAAGGLPIVNGVFYYPHASFWQRMQWPAKDWAVVNRYQHLGVYLLPDVDTPMGYRVVNASLDQLHVHVNPKGFDFARTGARRVAVPLTQSGLLQHNASLRWMGQTAQIGWFEVLP